MEKLDLDTELVVPTVTTTLANSLGIKHTEFEEYQSSIQQEINDHKESSETNP